MKVTFWGVRGSLPTPSKDTVIFGGNTPCVEVRADGEIIVLDAGTGIRNLGNALLKELPVTAHILISHTHWDHIMGLPFFTPVFIEGSNVHVYGPAHPEKGVEDIITAMMDYEFFPVSAMQLAADMHYHDLKEEEFQIGKVRLISQFLNHPVFMMGYRIEFNGKIIVYTGDHEPYYDFIYGEGEDFLNTQDKDEVNKMVDLCNIRSINFSKDADLLICDAQYTPEEYATKQGWGHSTMEQAVELAEKANVKNLALFHHDPTHTDAFLEKKEIELKKRVKNNPSSIKSVFFAREGLSIDL